MNYPRIAFITSHAFNNITGGGITLSHLFKSWPKDKILTIHNDNIEVKYDVCENYYLLQKEISIFGYNKKINSFQNNEKININYPILQNLKNNINGNSGLPWRFKPSKKLEEILNNYQPQVIYTLLGTIPIMQCVDWVLCNFNARLVVHFMDDWPKASYTKGLFKLINKRKSSLLLDKLVNKSDLLFAISDSMACEYKKRYKRNFKTFHNAIETQHLKSFKSKNFKSNKVVLYIGSLHEDAQAKSILDIAKVIETKNFQKNIRFELFITHNCYEYAKSIIKPFKNSFVYKTIADDKEYFERLNNSDLLVLPSNFDKHSLDFIGYSMPTKIPSYMVSKTPILVYGDKRSAQVKYALKDNWAYCVTSRDLDKLSKAISAILSDKDMAALFAKNAYDVYLKNHNLKTIKSRFQNEFQNI